MLNYLESLLGTEDDEVLFAIAEELGSVWELIPDKCLFLGILEKLCGADETVIRERAV